MVISHEYVLNLSDIDESNAVKGAAFSIERQAAQSGNIVNWAIEKEGHAESRSTST